MSPPLEQAGVALGSGWGRTEVWEGHKVGGAGTGVGQGERVILRDVSWRPLCQVTADDGGDTGGHVKHQAVSTYRHSE